MLAYRNTGCCAGRDRGRACILRPRVSIGWDLVPQSNASALISTHSTANRSNRDAQERACCQHGKPGCSQTPPTTTTNLTDRPRVHNASPSADRNAPLERTTTDRGLRGARRVAAPIAPAFAALNPNLGQLDPNGPNQGVVIPGWTRTRPFDVGAGPDQGAARHPRCGRDSGKNKTRRRARRAHHS